MSLTKQFYETLFDNDEWTCFADKGAKSVRTYPAISKGLKEENEYFQSTLCDRKVQEPVIM